MTVRVARVVLTTHIGSSHGDTSRSAQSLQLVEIERSPPLTRPYAFLLRGVEGRAALSARRRRPHAPVDVLLLACRDPQKPAAQVSSPRGGTTRGTINSSLHTGVAGANHIAAWPRRPDAAPNGPHPHGAPRAPLAAGPPTLKGIEGDGAGDGDRAREGDDADHCHCGKQRTAEVSKRAARRG